MSLKIKNYVALLEHLMQESVSAQDLTALTGMHIETTREFLKEMHKRKLVHIAGWDTRMNRRIKLPMYRLGEGVDQPKPKRLPSTVVTQRWRAKQKVKEQFDPFFAMCRPTQTAPNPVAIPDSGRVVTHRIAQPGEERPAPKPRAEGTKARKQSWFSAIQK